MAHAVDEAAPHHRPVKVIADQRLQVKTPAGTGVLPLYLSRDWTAPQPDITRAVIVIHGRLRNADVYLRSAEQALRAAGDGASATMLLVPQFLAGPDTSAFRLPDNVLRWGVDSWMGGEAARAPVPISSFDAIDALLAKLADRTLFPKLTQVILAGHSGGAQVVQRYAVVGRGEAGLAKSGVKLRYVIANPDTRHRVYEVPGVGHDGDAMLTSVCGLAALFDLPGCGERR